MDKINILVCDDDKDIANALEIYLKMEGYNVFKAYNGLEGLKIIEDEKINLAIIDIMMPQLDGLSALIKIRQEKNIPIIILSAKSEDTDKITGLNFGADDYVTKPFNPLELIARVKSQLRRYTVLGSMENKNEVIKNGGLEIDKEKKEVKVDGEVVRLTLTEYKILLLLMENIGRVFSIDEIYEKVWNEPSYSPENTVAVHIRRIREKIEINPKEPKYLKVVWGIGYKMEKVSI
ncbi:MAG: response regulator transcription factor [Caloramator sp.]|nr:response regulator transcription factor [Caloramator sp.]